LTMFPLKSDIFVWAGLYLLSRRIGEIGAKRVLWGIVWFIDTPCSDFHDECGRANGRADGPGRATGSGDLISTARADRPGLATGPGDLFSTLTRGGRPSRARGAGAGRGRSPWRRLPAPGSAGWRGGDAVSADRSACILTQ
jgi:hypothetical protein